MCKIIDFDAFLGVILETQSEITFQNIRKMVEQFESSSVVVDFSSGSVASALSHYPDFFAISRDKKCYSRAAEFNHEGVKEEFDLMIPAEIKQQINDILNEKSGDYVGIWR